MTTPTNEAPSLEGLADWLREEASILSDNKNFAVQARKFLRWASAVDSITAAPAPQEEWLREAERLCNEYAGAFKRGPSVGLKAVQDMLRAHLAKRIAPAPTLTDAQIDALDTFSLGWMAPRGKESVRAFARAILRATPSPEGSAVGNGVPSISKTSDGTCNEGGK